MLAALSCSDRVEAIAMLDFDTNALAAELARLTTDQISALPYGVIRLDKDLRVVFYSASEARLSGYGSKPTIGKLFFSDIAPCMRVPGFLGKIENARKQGNLDLEFGWIGDFSDRNRSIKVRIQSAHDGGIWIALKRDL